MSPVAITAGPGLRPHLSVLVESGPGAGTRVAANLSEDEARALLRQPGGLTDLTRQMLARQRRGGRQASGYSALTSSFW